MYSVGMNMYGYIWVYVWYVGVYMSMMRIWICMGRVFGVCGACSGTYVYACVCIYI